MDLLAPWLLLALVPALGLTVLAWRRSAVGLSPARRRAALALRLVLALALGLALAEARLVLPQDARAVVFAVDVSQSVPAGARDLLLDWVRRAIEARRPGDTAAVVVFGSEPRVVLPFGADLPAAFAVEDVPRDRTALDQALRVASGQLRSVAAEQRVVLLSDGNADEEPALREAMALASAGIPVTTVAVEVAPGAREVLVGDVTAPQVVAQDEAFLLRVEVVARSGGPARLQVERGGRHVATQDVELAPGTNVVAVPQRIAEPDSYVYRITVEARGDGDPANNVGGAFVRVRGRQRVLVVLGPEEDDAGRVVVPGEDVAAPLRAALAATGFEVVARGIGGLPLGHEDLARFDAFVLGDVGADRFTPEQMEAVRTWVFEQGGGLVALGGEESFGLGGYYHTPIEAALPVTSDVRNRRVFPSFALVYVVDRSGSMSGAVGDTTKIELVKQGVALSLDLLQPFDRVGVLGFAGSPDWLLPLRDAAERGPLRAVVHGLDATGGGTAIGPALVAAHAALAREPAQVRHVVLLTDGISDEAAWEEIEAVYRRDGITLSTVGVGRSIDEELLAALASATGGRFLWATEPGTVPRLLTKEAAAATRSLLIERPFRPRARGDLGVDVDFAGGPPLRGFVLTAERAEAEVLLDTGGADTPQDGPILVRWRYGLGKGVAFTSDATARWCGAWLGAWLGASPGGGDEPPAPSGPRLAPWPGYATLLGAVLRWAARDPEPPGLATALSLVEGTGSVRVVARAPDGAPLDGLTLTARVTAPDARDAPPLALDPTGPGTYEASFPATAAGAYFVAVERREGEGTQPAGSAGAVLAYPREYRDLTTNHALLERIARTTQGEALTQDHPPEGVFAGERAVRRDYAPLAPYLIALAAALLVLEVAVRRLVLPDALTRWLERRRARAAEAARARATQPGAAPLLVRLRAFKVGAPRRGGDEVAAAIGAPPAGPASPPTAAASASASASAPRAGTGSAAPTASAESLGGAVAVGSPGAATEPSSVPAGTPAGSPGLAAPPGTPPAASPPVLEAAPGDGATSVARLLRAKREARGGKPQR